MHVAPFEKGTPTVISQIGKIVFGGGPAGHVLYYCLQAGTMLILVLAANTSFADFPAAGQLPRRRQLHAPPADQAGPPAWCSPTASSCLAVARSSW